MPDAVLLDGAMFLKASLHCLKRQRGGVGGGGGAAAPDFQTQRLAHGRMILEAVLCVYKKAGVGVDATPLHLQAECLHHEF